MTTALVTGANRGIGRHLAAQLVQRGAKVYAAARRPETLDLAGAQPIALDITDPDAVSAAAALAGDADLLVNNAGISTGAQLLDDLDGVRAAMDVNFWGTLSMVRAFAPVLAANGGGTIVNVASALSWFAAPGAGAYAVSKAANWNMSNALRIELAAQGTQVTSVHLGLADTDMARGIEGPKTDPAVVARMTLDAVEAGDLEVVVDDWSAMVKASLAEDPRKFYARFGTA